MALDSLYDDTCRYYVEADSSDTLVSVLDDQD